MSEMDNKIRKKAAFDHMSTEELEELIRTDFQVSEDSDVTDILLILEVIEKREKTNPSGKYTDVETAWDSFNKNYRPANKKSESLYNFTDDDNTTTHSDINEPGIVYTNRHTRRPIKHKAFLRIACVLVSFIIVLLSGTIVAKALGFDLWNAVAKWTRDTFGFSSTVSEEVQESQDLNSQIYESLQDALDSYGITEKLTPVWLPDDYVLHGINIDSTPVQTSFIANYKSSTYGEIIILITSYTNPQFQTYEKDDENIPVYTVQGIEHYIISNIERRNIVWQTGNCECSISGNFSLDEAKIIIESIYGRNTT